MSWNLCREENLPACKMKKGQIFCCTDNLLLLPISGAFVIVLGVLVIVLYLVTLGLTTSLHLVEGTIPNYVSAIVFISSGIFTALLYFKPLKLLVFVAFLLGLSCIAVCLIQALTTLAISLPFLNSFTVCISRPTFKECNCYNLNGTGNITTIFAETTAYTFKGASCTAIQHTLKDFMYIFCIVYGFGVIACLFTTLLIILFWCRYKLPAQRKTVGDEGRVSIVEDVVSGSTVAENAADPESQEVTSGPPRVEEVTRSSSTYRYNGSRRTTVQRSSSINAASQSNPGPRVVRHHSIATADTSPPEGSTRPRREIGGQGRQRVPQILIRGGYLQSQLDGPTIPVYTLQGSSEAYISLTDLPSLQMPSLDSVPAFIPELPEPLPEEEPPPYSLQPSGYSGTADEGDVSSHMREGGMRDPQEVNDGEVTLTATMSQRGEEVTVGRDSNEGGGTSRQNRQSGDFLVPPQSTLINNETVTRDNINATGEPCEITPGETDPAPDPSRNRKKAKSVQRKPSRDLNIGDTTTAGASRSAPASDPARVSPMHRERRDAENKEAGIKKRDSQKVAQVKETRKSGHIKDASTSQSTGLAKSSSRRDTGSVGKPNEEEPQGKQTQRRKMPAVLEGVAKTTEEKKQRVRERVLSSSKKATSDRKQQPSATSDKTSGNPSPKAKLPKVKPSLPEGGSDERSRVTSDRKSSRRRENVAKANARRKSQNDVERAMKLEDANASSRESLSEMISLLESVRRSTGEGKQDKKMRKKQRRSPLEDMNFPDTKV